MLSLLTEHQKIVRAIDKLVPKAVYSMRGNTADECLQIANVEDPRWLGILWADQRDMPSISDIRNTYDLLDNDDVMPLEDVFRLIYQAGNPTVKNEMRVLRASLLDAQLFQDKSILLNAVSNSSVLNDTLKTRLSRVINRIYRS